MNLQCSSSISPLSCVLCEGLETSGGMTAAQTALSYPVVSIYSSLFRKTVGLVSDKKKKKTGICVCRREGLQTNLPPQCKFHSSHLLHSSSLSPAFSEINLFEHMIRDWSGWSRKGEGCSHRQHRARSCCPAWCSEVASPRLSPPPYPQGKTRPAPPSAATTTANSITMSSSHRSYFRVQSSS